MATVAAAVFLSDGKAVEVTLTSTVVKGDVIYAEGWLGLAGSGGDSDDVVACVIDQREYVFAVPSGLSVAKGATVYVDITSLTGHLPTAAGWATSAGSNLIRLFRATKAKDADNYCRGILVGGLQLS